MTHKKLIALDFDGVLHAYTTPWSDSATISDGPTDGAMEFLKDLVDDGRFSVCIVSSRLNEPSGDIAVQEFIRSNLYAEFGVCKGQVIQAAITFSKTRPPATVCIDDRAWNFQGTWPSLDRLAAFLPWNKKPRHLRPDPETAMAVADSLLMQIGQIARDAGCQDGTVPLDFIREQFPAFQDRARKAEAKALKLYRDCHSYQRTIAAMVQPVEDIFADLVVNANPGQWAQAMEKPELVGWFVGHVMKAVDGKANPEQVATYLRGKREAAIEHRKVMDTYVTVRTVPAAEVVDDGLSADDIARQRQIELIGGAILHWLSGGDQEMPIERLPRVGGDGVFFEWKVPFRGYHVFMPELAFAGCSTEAEARLVSESYLDAFADGQASERSKVEAAKA